MRKHLAVMSLSLQLGLVYLISEVLLIVLVPIFAAFIRRMNVEEEALSHALGSRYADYMKRTKRLVPFVY